MATGTTTFGDISPRTAAYAHKDLLERAIPYMVFEKFGQAKTLPARSTQTIKFRRYDALDATPQTLTEGVTPDSQKLTSTDVSLSLSQYYGGTTVTDVIEDTHEDPVLSEATDIVGEQAAEMIEKVRFNALKAGTNVVYANGASRSDVNTVMSRAVQDQVVRGLKGQNARKLTKVVRSTPSFGTVNVAPSYIGIAHPDLQQDLEKMEGFKMAEDYGAVSPYENEIGKAGEVRYLTSTVCEPWEDAGGDPTTNGVVTASGGSPGQADVYPLLIFGRDAYGLVALKGEFAVTPMVTNAKPSDSDPWAQRSHVTWKAMQGAVILNDLWMCRIEVAASDLTQ